MFVLALDTATPAVTAGIAALPADLSREYAVSVITDYLVATHVTYDARRHAEALAPQIRTCLAEAGAKPTDLVAVVAGVGPGPFTGLRVGLATAAVIADAVNCPSYAVCTLDAVALDALSRVDSSAKEPFLVATDARRKEVYWACYDSAGRRLRPPQVGEPEQVAGQLIGPGGPSWAVGAGASMYRDIFRLPIPVDAQPTAAALVAAAAQRIYVRAPSEVLTPLYLRRPDATVQTSIKAVV